MNTVLVVTTDSALRNRVQRSLGTFSVFEAASDAEAIKTLRLVDIDLVLRESAGPSGALSTFVASVRDVAPAALTIAIGAAGEEETAADFTVPERKERLRYASDYLIGVPTPGGGKPSVKYIRQPLL